MSSSSRIDKYLWSVRIYKTRTQASDACKNGRVFVNSTTIKPSRIIEIGDSLVVRKMPVIYTYRIKDIPPSRVGPKLVATYLEDMTPEEELAKLQVRAGFNSGHRKRGSGRPTKRERRDLDRLQNDD